LPSSLLSTVLAEDSKVYSTLYFAHESVIDVAQKNLSLMLLRDEKPRRRSTSSGKALICAFFSLTALVFILASSSTDTQPDESFAESRKLAQVLYLRALNEKSAAVFNIDALGTADLIQNRTVFGAMISSENIVKHMGNLKQQHFPSHEKEQNSTLANMSTIGLNNSTYQLPFPVVHWPVVLTKLCPSHRYRQSENHLHKLFGGIAYAHFQVWLDFIYFDHDVLQAVVKNEVKDTYVSTKWSSIGGTYMASNNGTLYKNNLPFYEDDIIVIFEDGAQLAKSNGNETLKAELSAMTTDMLILGWRPSDASRNPVISSLAYALTRRGATAAVKYFDPCRISLDEQFATMVKHNWLSHRSLLPESVTHGDNSSIGTGIFIEGHIFH
jgi:hypothetical protein